MLQAPARRAQRRRSGRPCARLAVSALFGILFTLAFALPAGASAAKFPLAINQAGSGSGGWDCEVEGGGLEPCEAEYPAGTELSVLAEPDPGSEFLEFFGDCGPLACELTMDEAHEATVVFELEDAPEFALNVETGGEGEGEVLCAVAPLGLPEPCEAEYPEGTELTLVAEAEFGSEFLEWEGNCAGAGTEAECELEIDGEKTVEAIFGLEPSEFALNIEEPGTGSGTVACEAEEGPEPCQAEYPAGTAVYLTAEAETGSEFLEWSGCDNVSGPGGEECEVEMGEEKTLEVVFEREGGEPSLTIHKAGTGSGEVECEVEGGGLEPCEAEYPEGTELSLVAKASPGSKFAGYSAGSGSAAACTTSPCSFTIEADSEVTATFNLKPTLKFALKVKKTGTGSGKVESTAPLSPKISCGTECEKEFEEGTKVTLVQSAAAGSKFSEWSGACTGTGTCEVTMSAAKEVSARFDLVPKFKLTVSKSGTGQGSVTSSPVGISCGATCSAEYEEGKEVTLTAAPEGGSTFAGWSGSGCSGTSTCKVTMSAAKEVAATFNPPPVVDAKLKIEKEGTGTGTVTSSPSGISCGATCESEYVEGTEVELTAAPSAGSKFVSWSGCTSESANHCKVKLTTSKVVKVRFDLIPKFALKVKKTGTGSGKVESTAPLSPKISCGTECEKEFEEGTKVTLVQSAAAGSKFSEWSGACTGTGTCEVTMSAAKEVSARFDLVPKFKLTVSKSGTGAGTVASTPAGVECGGTCSAEFEAGTEVELTASPEEGSEFLKWGGACSGTGSCQVTMSTAKSVSATFKAIPTHKLTVAKSGTGQGRVVSSPPITAIDCGTVCEAKLQAGTEVELIATPDPGSEFFKWSGACAGTGPCEVTMSAGKSVHATFKEAPKFMLSVIKTGPGSVTSSPAGIECGTQCAHEYSAGTALTLSATPARGYRLKGWSGCDGASGPTCTLRVNGARSLSATFVLTKCKKGFHRRKVNGKPRCARRRRHASHRPGARNSLALPAFWP